MKANQVGGDRIPPFSLEGLVSRVALELRNHFESSVEQMPHPGEKGASAEDAVREFIASYIPARFGLGGGLVVDTRREMSAQCDIVIYDQFIARPFGISDRVQVFPVEGVCAVGEVKSTLDSRNLTDALLKISRVKALDRTGAGRNLVYLGGGENGRPLTSSRFFDQVFGFALGFRGAGLDTLMNTMHAFCGRNNRKLWTNIVCVSNKGLVAYSNRQKSLVVEPLKAKFVSTLETNTRELLIFLQELFYFLQASRASEPNLSQYGWKGPVKGSSIRLK